MVRSISAQVLPVEWSATLGLPQLTAIPERLQKTEWEWADLDLKPANGAGPYRRVVNCRQYLDAVDEGYRSDSTSALKVETTFARDCYVLRDLATAQPARVSYLPQQWAGDVLRHLPPLFEGSVRSGTNHSENTHPEHDWAGVPGIHVTKNVGNELVVEDDDEQIFSLQIVGRGDFNGDGFEDLAIAAIYSMPVGSLLESSYFVLTRCRPNEQMRIVNARRAPYRLETFRCPS